MIRLKHFVTFIVTPLFFLIQGCTTEAPTDVASKYWEAVKTGTPFEEYIADTSQLEGWSFGENSLLGVKLGDETIIDNISHIKTEATFRAGENIQVKEFSTHLVKVDDSWKIDFNNTIRSLSGIEFSALPDLFGEGLGNAFNTTAKQFGEGMKQMIETLGSEMQKASEEMAAELEQRSAENSNMQPDSQ